MMEISAKDIKKEFIREAAGTNVYTAVNTCSMELRSGSLTVLKGRSGGGKTTLMNMLAGILKPTEGQILYDGRDIYSMNDDDLSEFRNKKTGYVPQGKSAVASLTVRENILLPCMLFGENAEDKADDLIKRFDIENIKNAYPEELSGGELRRMSIARALIREPEILFADEPTGDLDDENTELVFKLLKEQAKMGKTVFVVTHEDTAEEYADKVYLMRGGKLEG